MLLSWGTQVRAMADTTDLIAQYTQTIVTQRKQCVRCRKYYYEIENIGRWECMQEAFYRTGVDGHSDVIESALRRGVYVRADHADHEDELVYTPIDDLMITTELKNVFRHDVLRRQSIVPKATLFRDTIMDALPVDAPQINGVCGVRRYDHVAQVNLVRDRSLRYGESHNFVPQNKALTMRPVVHPFMPNGSLYEMREKPYVQQEVIDSLLVNGFAL